MTTGNVAIIVLITLAAYSIIGTIAWLLSKESDNVGLAFGLGFVGLTFVGLVKLIHAIRNRFKFHIGKRSIFEDPNTKKRYKCKTEYATDVFLAGKYKFICRYARKVMWKDLPDLDKDYIKSISKKGENDE